MNTLYKQLIRSAVLGTLILVALIFVPAGTLNYWQGWAFVAAFVVCSGAYTVYLARHDPTLLKRRTEAGISYEKEPAQKIIIVALYAAFAPLIVLPPLDHRFRWSNMPWYVPVLGDVLIVLAFYFFYLVSKVNTYAAANVRVEEGQKVISTGLYAYVRHPMYFAALLLVLGIPLALGSWWTLLLVPLFLFILYFRIENEERVLLRDLQGYSEYRQKVRYRVIPRIF